jgi:hypothetical protein
VIDENIEFVPDLVEIQEGDLDPPAPTVIGYAVAPQTEAQVNLNPPAPPPPEKPSAPAAPPATTNA